ncbi:hypothetical protein J132_06711 [Termitomyces sp. J132]|nr:hypothetical protein H2248_009958 [Termitomyces sp. 'cryptogamus']KNZ80205.1 hypothetical protein J132_06711 [Termitomyces sp. J132]
MDLILCFNNPQKTALISPNGTTHYEISTSKTSTSRETHGVFLSKITQSQDGAVVGEIEWGDCFTPTFVRCPLLRGLGGYVGKMGIGMTARTFLYKRSPFSDSRYFVDNDGVEYRWKTHKGVGCVLTSVHDNREIAKYTTGSRIEGFFAGEKKTFLRIQPCSLDLDLLVLSFAVMEKKRRERAGDLAGLVPHEDDDALGDGAGDGGGEA